MKKLTLSAAALAACLCWTACSSSEDKYTDLDTGETITVKKDANGQYVNEATGQPVRLYVHNTDTLEGKTGTIVNNKLSRSEDGRYMMASEMENSGAMTPGMDPNATGTMDANAAGTSTDPAYNNNNGTMTTTDQTDLMNNDDAAGTTTADQSSGSGSVTVKQKRNGDIKLKDENGNKAKLDRDGDVKVKSNGATYKRDGQTGQEKVK